MAQRRVECDAASVRAVTGSQVLWSVPWADAEKVVAYKSDLFTVDLIVIQLIGATGAAYEIDEDMAGYDAFLTALPAHFPGIREDWWREVALPAFAPNTTELWSRKT